MTARVKIEQSVGDGPARVTRTVEIEADYVNMDALTEAAVDLLGNVPLTPPESGVEHSGVGTLRVEP